MVSETYACAYQEVIEVLKYTRPEDVNKIPIGKIRYYIEHMSKSHNFELIHLNLWICKNYLKKLKQY